MPAQNGASLVLSYGAQGEQQEGEAIVLEYTTAAIGARRVVGAVTAVWGAAEIVRHTRTAPHPQTIGLTRPATASWAPGQALDVIDGAPWGVSSREDRNLEAPWGRYEGRAQEPLQAAWGTAARIDLDAGVPWGRYEVVLQQLHRSSWSVALPLDARQAAPWGGPMVRADLAQLIAFGPGLAADLRQAIPWGRFSRVLAPGWGIGTPDVPGGSPESPVFILPARFYMAVHSITAHRLPDLAEIPIYDITLSADSGSFAWSFTANGPDSLFQSLAPSDGLPTQLRITVDGLEWVFIVEKRQRSGAFAKAGVVIGGRSATALLGARWQRASMRLNDEARTAQQLAEEALLLTGGELDWGLTDWLVPAGAWSHQGTPLAAVQAIAEAAGGHLLSHRTEPTLLVRHPYPVAPWEWGEGAADVELAPDAVITSAVDPRDGSDVDAVYVSGTTQGVRAWVKRTGTAGENLAPMVADPLITAVAAARQRGLSVVGAEGSKHFITLDLPVLTGAAEPGVLDVGQLVQVNDAIPWRGRVRSVNVQGRRPTLRQSVTLERHL